MNIRVNLNTNIADGSEVVFRSPADCSQVTGLVIYHTGGKTEFAFADAHGHNVGDIDHLFAENAVVKVILDVTAGMAFVQNADTNAYIERTFVKTVNGHSPDEAGNVELTAEDVGALREDALQDGVDLALKQAKESGVFDGKDGANGKDGEDYILTDADKQEIADMIPVPDIPGGGGGYAISVKDCGAIGDGVADDTVAIQAALDACHGKGGGTVIIPTGTYLLSDAVKFYSDQYIKGEPGAVLLQNDGNTGGAYGNLMRNYYAGQGGYDATENVVIEGLTFDGGDQEDAPTALLTCCHSRDILFRNCTFQNGYSHTDIGSGHDIEVNSSANVNISWCKFRNNRRWGYGSEIIQVDGAYMEGAYPWPPDEGERNDDNTVSDGVTISRCFFDGEIRETLALGNTFVGSHGLVTAKNIVVEHCIIRNACYGIIFNSVEGLTVRDNIIYDTAAGVMVKNDNANAFALNNIFFGTMQTPYNPKVIGQGNILNGVPVEDVGGVTEDRVGEMISEALGGIEGELEALL